MNRKERINTIKQIIEYCIANKGRADKEALVSLLTAKYAISRRTIAEYVNSAIALSGYRVIEQVIID